MTRYSAPLRDMQFVLYELFNAEDLTSLPGFEDATRDLVDPILIEAAKINAEVLYPLNRTGDEEGCIHNADGSVTTPTGFKEAYKLFSQGGWTGIACTPEYGGMGLPKMITSLVNEMCCSANLSFGMYPGLTYAAYKSINAHATAELKQRWLPNMIDGTWSGTMCLTEPHCGTDLGLCRTKADPNEDGSYNITGTKIFISAGEHDLSENIIHLVLAKLPNASEGTKGLSLFLVPKFSLDENDQVGAANNVTCGAIEHKMGIKASSTCVMNFDGAKGFIIGHVGDGMKNMFTVMNQARLDVAGQGLGLAEISYQGAVEYARDRIQGRSLTGVKQPETAADPIIVHPDVRRMLLTMRSYIEGMRALSAWVAQEIDHSLQNPDDKRKNEADDFVQLMTPIVKALFTDLGYECANHGVQVFGGHGFIREHGMEQYIRDARIAQIYEGTNGIQALDLIGRKMPAYAGRYLRSFFHPVQAYIEKYVSDPKMAEFVQPLAKSFMRLQQVTGYLAEAGIKNPDDAAAGATEYLRLIGLVSLGFMWCKMAELSLDKMDGDDAAFYQAKIETARFYVQKLMPQCSSLATSIMAGSASTMGLSSDAF